MAGKPIGQIDGLCAVNVRTEEQKDFFYLHVDLMLFHKCAVCDYDAALKSWQIFFRKVTLATWGWAEKYFAQHHIFKDSVIPFRYYGRIAKKFQRRFSDHVMAMVEELINCLEPLTDRPILVTPNVTQETLVKVEGQFIRFGDYLMLKHQPSA